MADFVDTRPASEEACIYWTGNFCSATDYFAEEDITCYNDGNCDGFGTCRGCAKYDQGGLKIDESDGQGGETQTPINLQIFNIRARIQPCCHWDGPIVDFVKDNVSSEYFVTVLGVIGPVGEQTVQISGDNNSLAKLPQSASATARKEGSPDVTVSWTSRTDSELEGVTLSPPDTLEQDYQLFVSETSRKATPIFTDINSTPDESKSEQKTFCVLQEAAPWQAGLTEENPAAYGCNGAKPECPFYTGPEFTEVVDEKMDTGQPVTAKQIMELRFYSANWKSIADPRAVWEQRFEQADLWGWARDPDSERNYPGSGLVDEAGVPFMKKVTIQDFDSDVPIYSIGGPQLISGGTPVIGGPPSFPDAIRELFLLPSNVNVIWPANTTAEDPFIRKTFTPAEKFIYISVQIHSDQPSYAVNLTKHPQGGTSSENFIAGLKDINPKDVIAPVLTGMPELTFIVPLESGGSINKLNQIRIFLQAADGSGTFTTADVWIEHVFHHAHVAQTSFTDHYGQPVVDPWINHFTRISIEGETFDFTNNTSLKEVLWNTIASNGKKTLYAVETTKQITVGSSNTDISWESLACNTIALTFLDKNINRVFPWKAWNQNSKGESLFVQVDRSENDDLLDTELKLVPMQLAFVSTKGTAIPANVALFVPDLDNESVRPFNVDKDKLIVKYAYTEYKQGPIDNSDIPNLKFPADSTKVIDFMPYEVGIDGSSFEIDGTFLRVGDDKIYSCEDVLGDCYFEVSPENQQNAELVFKAGGVGEGDLKTQIELVNDCIDEFEAKHAGQLLEDGTPATWETVVEKLENIHFLEGDQEYVFIFNDKEGRPIGSKSIAFLTQSTVAQTRDVEIKYQWRARIREYVITDTTFFLARFAGPPRVHDTDLYVEYDPYCGDHHEGSLSSFNLGEDEHGALWYPYSRCLVPEYHPGDSGFFEPSLDYSETPVEGFGSGVRRNYWERMRVWDRFYPVHLGSNTLLAGCVWPTYDSTVGARPPWIFTGYTKIRSIHPLGPFASDRESLRISRHWRKKNLTVEEETVVQEPDGITVDLTDEFEDTLLDEDGNLEEGEDLQTPVWIHMNDGGLSVVSPAAENLVHPFTNLLIDRCGSYPYGEIFSDERLDLADVLEERDYTSSEDRSEDGTQIYDPDETTANEGSLATVIEEGNDIRWVFGQSGSNNISWAWLPPVPEPIRGIQKITGLFLSNPEKIIFKKNREPATYTTEGTHSLTYTAHQFEDDGSLASEASLQLDIGPVLHISQDDGSLFIPIGDPSPYDPLQHVNEDYEFVLHGPGGDGFGILADGQGLQRYELGGDKFATFAGVGVNLTFDINDLPHEVLDLRFIDRDVITTPYLDALDEFITDHEAGDQSVKTLEIDFKGHYFVENIEIVFFYGEDRDVPVIRVLGVQHGSSTEEQLAADTTYLSGDGIPPSSTKVSTFILDKRLSSLAIQFGARHAGKGFHIQDIKVFVRNHINRTENVFLFAPKVQVSTATPGTHRPSDLEVYFQRINLDFAENYGGISNSDPKYTSRRIKDIIPQFEFTDTEGGRFPYDNINFAEIEGYVEEQSGGRTISYINPQIETGCKGWTMSTTAHQDDPGGDLNHPNSFDGEFLEDRQEEIYNNAGSLLGDKTTVFNSFWHPAEIEFFADVGVDLNNYSWTLTMVSTLAPISRVFRHPNYGCGLVATSEDYDGNVHSVENWQAAGVYLYSCDPGYNYACNAVVMSKCFAFIFEEYGTSDYIDNNVQQRYTYTFAFDPRDATSWIDAGIINNDYTPR